MEVERGGEGGDAVNIAFRLQHTIAKGYIYRYSGVGMAQWMACGLVC